MTTIESKTVNPRFSSSRLRLIVAGILAIVVCLIIARVIYNTSTFFSLMENLQMPWNLGADSQSTEAYLSDLKQIARFVLNAPKTDRRIMISTYSSFMNMDTSIHGKYFGRAVNLHLLQLLIFDVPQEYPREKARSFGAFLWESEKVPYETETESNMLWPFEYDHGHHLTITAPLARLWGDYYGTKEYSYFSSQFNFRSIDELK